MLLGFLRDIVFPFATELLFACGSASCTYFYLSKSLWYLEKKKSHFLTVINTANVESAELWDDSACTFSLRKDNTKNTALALQTPVVLKSDIRITSPNEINLRKIKEHKNGMQKLANSLPASCVLIRWVTSLGLALRSATQWLSKFWQVPRSPLAPLEALRSHCLRLVCSLSPGASRPQPSLQTPFSPTSSSVIMLGCSWGRNNLPVFQRAVAENSSQEKLSISPREPHRLWNTSETTN